MLKMSFLSFTLLHSPLCLVNDHLIFHAAATPWWINMSVSDFCMPWRQRRRRRRQWRRRWQRRWRRRCIKYPANIRRRTKEPKRTNSGKKVTQQLGWKFSSYQPIIIIIFVAAFNSFLASSLEMCFLIFLTLSLPLFLFLSLCTQSMYLLFVSHSLIPVVSPSTS